ncbi:MAG TPA: hypothetical protein VGC13_22305 [Longimicrobium sp.]|uniref:hypothetical protein n=1 Tax=Longimicrobium sp. TaxID=2029185 RepID=UPI002ED9B1B2
MSLVVLRPRVEQLVSSARVSMPLTRVRLIEAVLAARPGALGGMALSEASLADLEALATAAELEVARRLDVGAHLRVAALKYSRHKPREVVVDILASSGVWRYPMPAGWVHGFSVVRRVESPVDQRPPAFLGAREYRVMSGPDGDHLAFAHLTPGVGQVVRVTFTAPHELAETGTTLPETGWDTVVKLAAGTACLELAAFYSHEQDGGLQLEGVRHGSKGGEFQKRGEAFRKEAEAELPELRAEAVRMPAAGEVSLAADTPFLTH